MPSTPNLQIPLLAPAQAQKHVTHNEALIRLDALVQLVVKSHTIATPPASPVDGDRYIIPAAATGAWGGRQNQIAVRDGTDWIYCAPLPGWRAWVESATQLVLYNGTSWSPVAMHETDRLGINAAADTTNRLSVSSHSSLFNHAGNGHQMKLNKAAAGDTASLLYQTGFSGRAEIGLTGNDQLHIKVSSDGATWREAAVIEPTTGHVGLGTAYPSTTLHIAGPARVGQFAKSALPAAASSGAGAIIFVTDESGGAVLAFSDGADWRRVTDRAIVS